MWLGFALAYSFKSRFHCRASEEFTTPLTTTTPLFLIALAVDAGIWPLPVRSAEQWYHSVLQANNLTDLHASVQPLKCSGIKTGEGALKLAILFAPHVLLAQEAIKHRRNVARTLRVLFRVISQTWCSDSSAASRMWQARGRTRGAPAGSYIADCNLSRQDPATRHSTVVVVYS